MKEKPATATSAIEEKVIGEISARLLKRFTERTLWSDSRSSHSARLPYIARTKQAGNGQRAKMNATH